MRREGEGREGGREGGGEGGRGGGVMVRCVKHIFSKAFVVSGEEGGRGMMR